MLTSDLVRVRRRAGRITPRFLGPQKAQFAGAATQIVAAFAASVGERRSDLDERLAAVPRPARERLVVDGLIKLCEDRLETEAPSGLEPEFVRREVFTRATVARRDAPLGEAMSREDVLQSAATQLGASVEEVERALFADLADAQVVRAFAPITPTQLLDRYDVALAQAVLLRAVRVTIDLKDEPAATMRALFRAARFHGLLHEVSEAPKGGQRIVVDGPFSLFDSVQRYGLKLATFLPHVLACRSFSLVAEVLHGPARTRHELHLDPKSGLVGAPADAPLRSDVAALLEAFTALGSAWTAAPADRFFALPGQPVVVPDLVFTHRETGEEVYLEAFGFWSRDAVWRRVEQIRAGFPVRMILAVSKKLRVSEAVLDESDASELYVFGTALSAREVLSRLERIGAAR